VPKQGGIRSYAKRHPKISPQGVIETKEQHRGQNERKRKIPERCCREGKGESATPHQTPRKGDGALNSRERKKQTNGTRTIGRTTTKKASWKGRPFQEEAFSRRVLKNIGTAENLQPKKLVMNRIRDKSASSPNRKNQSRLPAI